MAVDKLVDSTQLDTDLTSVANAIRTKGGTSAQMAFPAGFVSAVQAIPTGITPTGTKQISITANGTTTEDVAAYASAEITVDVQGGGTDYLELLCNNQLVSYESTGVTTIPQRLFYQKTALVSISLPNAATINEYAFNGCTSLTSVNLPKIKRTANSIFQNCSSLQSYDFSDMTHLDSPNAFQNAALTGIYAPKAVAVGTWGGGCFQDCTALIYARFPVNAGLTRQSTFKNCTSLKLVDMGKSTQLSDVGETFSGCTALEILILRRTGSITPCGNINAFNNVGLQNPVKVYCPSALISTYQNTATNWSTLYTNGRVEFLALEGSPYEAEDFIYEGVPA